MKRLKQVLSKNLKPHNRLKIHQHLTLVITSITLTMALILFVLIRTFTNDILIRQHLQKYLSYAHQYFEINISDMLENIHMEATPLHLNMDLEHIISSGNPDEIQLALSTEVNKIVENSELIDAIRLIDNTGKEYTFAKETGTISNIDTAFLRAVGAYDIAVSPQTATDDAGTLFVVFGNAWINYTNSVNLGKILIFVDHEKILDMYQASILDDSSIYITLGDTVLSASNRDSVGKQILFPEEMLAEDSFRTGNSESGKYIINTHLLQTAPPLKLTMTIFVSKDYLYNTMDNYNALSLALLFSVILVSILAAYLISARLSHSIRSLTARINYQKPFRREPHAKNDNEISVLENRFHEFIKEIDILIAQNREAVKQKKEAEFAALQAQINPHFLYNTLESISGMAKMQNQPEIKNVCVALGRFFRLSLQKGENTVPVENEINHVKSYVTVEQIRFPNKFEVTFDIDETLYNYRMPKILLQPIVENAIHHAFNRTKKTGKIRIMGKTEGEYILFCIEDNGVGLQGIDPLAQKDNTPSVSGYGLNNVNMRIQLAYGNDCGLFFEETPGGGTTVIVKLKATPNS